MFWWKSFHMPVSRVWRKGAGNGELECSWKPTNCAWPSRLALFKDRTGLYLITADIFHVLIKDRAGLYLITAEIFHVLIKDRTGLYLITAEISQLESVFFFSQILFLSFFLLISDDNFELLPSEQIQSSMLCQWKLHSLCMPVKWQLKTICQWRLPLFSQWTLGKQSLSAKPGNCQKTLLIKSLFGYWVRQTQKTRTILNNTRGIEVTLGHKIEREIGHSSDLGSLFMS